MAFLFLLITAAKGIVKSEARKYLAAQKVNGPISSIPTICATNDVPHMNAVRVSISSAATRRLFIFIYLSQDNACRLGRLWK